MAIKQQAHTIQKPLQQFIASSQIKQLTRCYHNDILFYVKKAVVASKHKN